MLTLRSTWTKMLRDYRVAILIWGLGLGLAVVLTLASYDMMGAASRAATVQYAVTFRFLGEPVALNTAAGYATWHTVGLLPVMLAIWTVLAGARLVRGDEERGEMDILLSTAESRPRQFAERLAALVTGVLFVALIMTAVTVIGEPAVGMRVDVGAALLMSLNVALTALVFGLTATLLAQVFRHRAAAASIAGGLVVLSYLVNATGRIMDNGEWLRRFSPLYYHDLSKPLIPSYGTNIGAFMVLAGASLVLAGVSGYLFSVRDIGGVVVLPVTLPQRFAPHWARSHRAPSSVVRVRHDVSLRAPGVRSVQSQLASIVWWMLGLLAITAWVTVVARSSKDLIAKMLSGTPALAQLLGAYDVTNDTGLIAALVFFYVPVISVLFAMLQAMPWSSDLEQGRLELPLGTPFRRWRMYAERFAAVVVACIVAPIVAGAGILVAAWLAGLSLNMGRLTAALAGLIPIELIAAAAVYLLAGWLRSGALAAVVGTAIGVSYFAELFNPLLKLPDWLISISIFHQYGSPLSSGPNWWGWLVIFMIAGVFAATGGLRFLHEDIRGRA